MSSLVALALLVTPQITPRPRVLRRYNPVTWGIQSGMMLELSLELPGNTGARESFGLYVPYAPAPSAPNGLDAPLLVHFHAYGGSHGELMDWCHMAREADMRGWFLVAPDQDWQAPGGPSGSTYGNTFAQERVQAVIDWALETFPIDKECVYGYGFSMGGADCLTFAAQHRDPERGAFAALVSHTGPVQRVDEIANNPFAALPMESAYGRYVLTDPRPYLAASVLEYAVVAAPPGSSSPVLGGQYVPNGRHAIVNLQDTPLQSWFNPNDTYFQFTELLADRLTPFLGVHERRLATVPSHPNVPPTPGGAYIPHHWAYMDAAEACSFLENYRLKVQWAGDLVIARDARYHDLWLTRKDSNELGQVGFELPPQSSDVTLGPVSNLREIAFDAQISDLDVTGGVLRITVARDSHPQFLGRPVIVEVHNLGFDPAQLPGQIVQTNATAAPIVDPSHGPNRVRFVSAATNLTEDVFELRR